MRLAQNDLPVLRELLGWSEGNFPQGSLAITAKDVALRTGLHRNTVSRRMKALSDGGVVDGYLFEPHPALLGLVRAGHRFDGVVVADAEELGELLAPFPWVSMAILHMDSCFLHTWHEGDVEGDIEALAARLGATGTVTGFRSDQWPPGPPVNVSPLDRRILLALRRGPRRSVEEIAAKVGAGRRTVARHLERLSVGAGAMMPIFRPANLEGVAIAVMEGPAGTGAAQALVHHFPDRIMGPVVAGPRAMVLVPVSGMDEAARRAGAARKDLPGLELQFMRDGLFPEACDAWLEARVQNAPPAAANA